MLRTIQIVKAKEATRLCVISADASRARPTCATDVPTASWATRAATPDCPLTKLLRRELQLSTPRAAFTTGCTTRRSSARSRASSSTPSSSTPSATPAPSTTPTAPTTPSTSTAATASSSSSTTSTKTATPTSPTTPILAPLALAALAPPSRSRRITNLLSTKEVDSSSRGNRGHEQGGGTPLEDGGEGSATGGSYSEGSRLSI
ncbi:unnamed protein product [Closterium sp. NIES-53]